MRRVGPPLLLACPLLACLLLAACQGPVAPRVSQPRLLPLQSDPTLFVSSDEGRVWIERTLEDAGLRTADPRRANYLLVVEVGVVKAQSSCGQLRNVRYGLVPLPPSAPEELPKLGVDDAAVRSGQRDILELKGRGWTGSCRPNIFQDMSSLLARQFQEPAVP